MLMRFDSKNGSTAFRTEDVSAVMIVPANANDGSRLQPRFTPCIRVVFKSGAIIDVKLSDDTYEPATPPSMRDKRAQVRFVEITDAMGED